MRDAKEIVMDAWGENEPILVEIVRRAQREAYRSGIEAAAKSAEDDDDANGPHWDTVIARRIRALPEFADKPPSEVCSDDNCPVCEDQQ